MPPPGRAAGERRRFPRKWVGLTTTYCAEGRTHLGVVRDLSECGAFVETAALLDSGTAVRLFFSVPGRPRDDMPFEGWVVRVVRRRVRPGVGPLVGMGIEFLPSPEQQERLRGILAAAPERRPAPARRTATRNGRPRAPLEPTGEADAGAAPGDPATPAAERPTVPPPDVPADGGRSDRYAETPALRLSEMRAGQIRTMRLRLRDLDGATGRPTDLFLDVGLTCDLPGKLYYLEAKADFGRLVPPSAELHVLKNRYEAAGPATLVERGRPVQVGVDLDLGPAVERIVLWIRTDGRPEVPAKLAAEIHVRPPAGEEPRAELDTLRLPSIKLIVKHGLAGVLRRSPFPDLAILGEALGADVPERKLALLRRLVDANADVRLVEAAVRDVDLCERTVEGFPGVPFEELDLDDPVHALLAVFHPGTAPSTVHRFFVVAFEARARASRFGERPWWTLVLQAAAVLLSRDAPELLDDDLEALQQAGNREGSAALRGLVEWAARVDPLPAPAESPPLETCLRDAALPDRARAERALVAVLTCYGFVGLSARLAGPEGS